MYPTAPSSASAPPTDPALLVLEDVRVSVDGGGRQVELLRGVSFDVRRGEVLALVGESGCGKSLTALAVLGLLPPGVEISGGRIVLAGEGDLVAGGEGALRRVRGRRAAMVFQEPATALDPVFTIGFQIVEALRWHRRLGRRAARTAAVELLERVAMPDPARRLDAYPHELSGGQRQRALIALTLAAGPDLLLADEPTTALDVTVQAQILDLLLELRDELGLTIVLITHDLGIVAGTCDRAAVMYAGQVVEEARVGDLFRAPAHPYTEALLRAVPRLGEEGERRGIPGRIPEPGALPPGCAFHPRCPRALDRCRRDEPELLDLGPPTAARRVRCVLHRPPAPEAGP